MSKYNRWSLLVSLIAVLISSLVAAQRVNPLAYDDPSFGWQDNRDPDIPRVSPNAVVGLQIGATRVMVAYGRPSLGSRNSLLKRSSGRIWRTGADEATTITFGGQMILQGEHRIEAGTYSLFTIPGQQNWTIVLNRENNLWGTSAYDSRKDALRIEVSVQDAPFHQDRLSFVFEEIDVETFSASLMLHWGSARAVIRLREP